LSKRGGWNRREAKNERYTKQTKKNKKNPRKVFWYHKKASKGFREKPSGRQGKATLFPKKKKLEKKSKTPKLPGPTRKTGAGKESF